MFFFAKKTASTPFSKTTFLLQSLALLLILTSSANAEKVGIYNQATDEVAGVTALMSAVVSHDIQGVIFFSKSGKALINKKNYGGATALHLAARSNQIEIAKILIDNGARIDATDNEKWTPLMRATLAGNPEMVKLLLKNGAQGDAKNSVKETIIFQAIMANCNACLSSILNDFDFPKYVPIQTLTKWLNHAYASADNKGDEGAKEIISDYLDLILADQKAARDKASLNFQEQSLETPSVKSNAQLFKLKATTEKPLEAVVKETAEKISTKEIALPNKGSEIVPAPIKFFRFKTVKPAKLPEVTEKEIEPMEIPKIEEKPVITNHAIKVIPTEEPHKKTSRNFTFNKETVPTAPVQELEETQRNRKLDEDSVEAEFTRLEQSKTSPKKRFKWWRNDKEIKSDVIEEDLTVQEPAVENELNDIQEVEKTQTNKEFFEDSVEAEFTTLEQSKNSPKKRFKWWGNNKNVKNNDLEKNPTVQKSEEEFIESAIENTSDTIQEVKESQSNIKLDEDSAEAEFTRIEEPKSAPKKRFKLWKINEEKKDPKKLEKIKTLESKKTPIFKFKKGGEHI